MSNRFIYPTNVIPTGTTIQTQYIPGSNCNSGFPETLFGQQCSSVLGYGRMSPSSGGCQSRLPAAGAREAKYLRLAAEISAA